MHQDLRSCLSFGKRAKKTKEFLLTSIFVQQSCLKTWLAKSRTCPLCRSACSDSAAFFIRVHLQSVSNLDASFYDPALSVLKDSAKDKEIEDLRRQLADCRSTIDKIRSYYNDAQKLYRHIGIELGVSPQEDSIIDLSISPIILPPPAVLASSTITTRVASRVTTSTRPTTASSHRPATTISSRVRRNF